MITFQPKVRKTEPLVTFLYMFSLEPLYSGKWHGFTEIQMGLMSGPGTCTLYIYGMVRVASFLCLGWEHCISMLYSQATCMSWWNKTSYEDC